MNTYNMTLAQRRRVIQLIRFFRERNRYTKCTSVRVELCTEYQPRFLSVVVETRRSDCDRYSPRQMICKQRLHAMIGKRGGMTVASASDGLRSMLSHCRTMLNAR